MAHPPDLGHLVAVPTGVAPLPASDVSGCDLAGRRRTLRLAAPGRWTLLLFLGSHCDGCLPFWTVARAPEACGLEPGDAAFVVTHDPADEEPVALATLMGGDLAEASELLVMSDAAWRAYRVLGPPFFVLLDGAGVATEGVAWSVDQVAADVARVRRPRPDEQRSVRA